MQWPALGGGLIVISLICLLSQSSLFRGVLSYLAGPPVSFEEVRRQIRPVLLVGLLSSVTGITGGIIIGSHLPHEVMDWFAAISAFLHGHS